MTNSVLFTNELPDLAVSGLTQFQETQMVGPLNTTRVRHMVSRT